MNMNRKLVICASVVSTAISLTGDHEASGRDEPARPAVTRRAAVEPAALAGTETDEAPATDQVTEMQRQALNVLKQTKVAVKFQIVPRGLLGKDPKLALKTAISVESPQLHQELAGTLQTR